MALTPEQIDQLIQQADGLAPKEGSIFRALVKLTEAEVRKDDEALIRGLLVTQHAELIERLRQSPEIGIDPGDVFAAADALEALTREIEGLRKDAERLGVPGADTGTRGP